MKRPAGCLQHHAGPNRNGSSEDHVMAKRPLPSLEELRQLLSYDSETGIFTWKKRTDIRSAVNARLEGKPAGFVGKQGYIRIEIRGVTHSAHRLAWVMTYGEWPEAQLDHINGDPADNRIVNLRCVTEIENSRNRSLPKDNKTGVIGVHTQHGKFVAQIKNNGQIHRLGSFEKLSDAAEARRKAELELGFHPNHGRRESLLRGSKEGRDG